MLLLAAVCLAGQVTSISHMLVVPHERCAEHGALVHSGAHGREVAGHVVEARARAASRAALMSAAGADGHDHDHCLACTNRRKSVLGAAAAVCVPTSSSAPTAQPVPQRPRWAARAIYGFAPKCSPPV